MPMYTYINLSIYNDIYYISIERESVCVLQWILYLHIYIYIHPRAGAGLGFKGSVS